MSVENENPFASPQSFSTAANETIIIEDRDPRWLVSSQGAEQCRSAVVTSQVTLIIGFVMTFIFMAEFLCLTVVLVGMLIAIVLYALGLAKMMAGPPEAGANGLFKTALIAFWLAVAFTIAYMVVLVFNLHISDSATLTVLLLRFVSAWSCLFISMLGQRKTGLALNDRRIVFRAGATISVSAIYFLISVSIYLVIFLDRVDAFMPEPLFIKLGGIGLFITQLIWMGAFGSTFELIRTRIVAGIASQVDLASASLAKFVDSAPDSLEQPAK